MTNMDMKVALYGISTTEGLEAFAQRQVNRLAPIIAERYPEVAQNNPKAIGAMAKALVMQVMSETVYN